MTQPTADNLLADTATTSGAATSVDAVAGAVAQPSGPVVVEETAVMASFPGSEALRDYGQRLSDALRLRAVALSAPAGRRAMLPVVVALLAALIAARDVLFAGDAIPSTAAAALRVAANRDSARRTSENLSPALRVASPLRAWLDQPLLPVGRNIFAPNLATASRPADFGEPQAKSGRESTDAVQGQSSQPTQPAHLEIKTDRVAASGTTGQDPQVRQIRLQSTLLGANPTALVNGQMVREGDVVASGSGIARAEFRVLKIEARRIILEREGVRSEIPIDR